MNGIDPEFLISLAGGLLVLFFGRRFFWVYIGLVGLLSGFELAREMFPLQPQWVFLLAGLMLGVCMALLAMAFQYVAVALAGFAGGTYLALKFAVVLPMIEPNQIPSWLIIVPGILAAIVCVAVFNPALIVLSSLTGAVLLTQLIPIDPPLQYLLLVALAAAGLAFQFMSYRNKETVS